MTFGAPEFLEDGTKCAGVSGLRALDASSLRRRLAEFNLKPVFIVVAGNGGSAALAVLANWMVATKLTPAQFGLFSLALALMTILQELGGPALDTAIVRFAASHSKSDPVRAEAYFKAGFRLKLLVSGLLCGGLILLAGPLARNVYHEPLLRPLFYWMAAGLVAANLSTFILARLQAAERFTAYSIQRALANGLKVLLLGFAWAAGRVELETVTAIWTLSIVITYMIGAKLCPAPGSSPAASMVFDNRPYREIAGFAKWVMLAGLLFAVHMRTDILLLGWYWTNADAGYYSIAWNLMLFLDLITSSIVAALLPAASKLKAAGERADFWLRTVAVSALVAVALSPLYFFSDTIVATLFPKYLPAIGPFHILFWSSIIMLMIYPLYLGFYAQNKPVRVSVTYATLMLVSAAAGLIIIPRYGLLGAAYTTLIARAAGGIVILMFLFADRRRMNGAGANV